MSKLSKNRKVEIKMHYLNNHNMTQNERNYYNNTLDQVILEDSIIKKINQSVDEHVKIIKKDNYMQNIKNLLVTYEKERVLINSQPINTRIHKKIISILTDSILNKIRLMHPIHIINKIKSINENYYNIYTIQRNELRDYANGNVTASGSKNELWNEVKRVENMSKEEFLYEFTELMYLRHELKRR